MACQGVDHINPQPSKLLKSHNKSEKESHNKVLVLDASCYELVTIWE